MKPVLSNYAYKIALRKCKQDIRTETYKVYSSNNVLFHDSNSGLCFYKDKKPKFDDFKFNQLYKDFVNKIISNTPYKVKDVANETKLIKLLEKLELKQYFLTLYIYSNKASVMLSFVDTISEKVISEYACFGGAGTCDYDTVGYALDYKTAKICATASIENISKTPDAIKQSFEELYTKTVDYIKDAIKQREAKINKTNRQIKNLDL